MRLQRIGRVTRNPKAAEDVVSLLSARKAALSPENSSGVRTLFLAFLVLYGAHSVAVIAAQRHLYGDAAWYLVKLASNGAVTTFYQDFRHDFYYSRVLAYSLTQWPTVIAIKVGVTDLAELSAIYGTTFFFWKIASVMVSLRLLPPDRKSLVMLPILSVLAGTMNSDIYMVTETHIATAFFWPLLIAAVWLPARLTFPRAACMGLAAATASFLYESMAFLLPIVLLALIAAMRARERDRASRVNATMVAATLALGTAMNWASILFPRDSTNKEGFRQGIQLIAKDALAHPGNAHIGPLVSVVFILVAMLTMLFPWRGRFVLAAAGTTLLAVAPPAHFLAFRGHLVFWNAISDRGFGGLVMQLVLAAFFLVACRWESIRRELRSRELVLLATGLMLGQVAWHGMATKAWAEATAVVRGALASRPGPQLCNTLSRESAEVVGVTLDRVLCNWWITPLSIVLSPDGAVSSLILSKDRFKAFDPLDPSALPSMRFTQVRYDAYSRELQSTMFLRAGSTVSFRGKDSGWVFLTSGFALAEDWATWSDGPDASMKICFREDVAAPPQTILRFKTEAFTPEERPELRVLVSSGTTGLAEWEYRRGDRRVERALALPAHSLHRGCASLNFRFSDLASPQSLGLSADPRRLGIALIEMRVEP